MKDRSGILVCALLMAPLGACDSSGLAAQSDEGEGSGAEDAGDVEAAQQELTSTFEKPSAKCNGAQKGGTLPVKQIEDIVQIEGEVSHGVLDLEIERKDIGDVKGPRNVTFTPSFEVHGDAYFQPLSCGQALLNGDMALTEEETNPFISALLKNGLVFQAFHQHLPTHPQVWFIHYRGVGDPLALARAIRAAIGVTHTPLPQMPPPHPTTPLDPERLAKILHGDATVGDEGVVTVTVPRSHGVILGGVEASPEAGISTVIEFKPHGASNADVVPDFSMTSKEVGPVVNRMLVKLGWFQGCLYNQETAEQPQLYFDHMLKSGDPYVLAKEIRRGLDLTQSK
jgi:hypothetical protein